MSALVFVVVMLLLVVASNVATLVFARTWSRAPELAVRTALGAARKRVVGQLFFETLVLGSIAAVIGLVAASSALSYIRNSLEGWPFWITLEPNPRIVAFVVFLTLLVGVVSGLWPALRVTRHDLRQTLQAGRGFAAGGFGRAGAVLLVVEIALSVALLNGAVTMARAFESYIDDVPALPKGRVLTANLGRVPSNELRAARSRSRPRSFPVWRPLAPDSSCRACIRRRGRRRSNRSAMRNATRRNRRRRMPWPTAISRRSGRARSRDAC